MGMIRPTGSVSATAGTPTPVFTGPAANLLTVTGFSILSGIATVLVANAYNPNDIVGLYGFSTATYFNGVPVTVLDCTAAQFRFYFNNADVSYTADAGKCFIQPPTYRAVRLELTAAASTHTVYVGDGMVSSTKYVTALTLTKLPFVEIDGNAIPAGRIHIDTDSTSTAVMVSLIY